MYFQGHENPVGKITKKSLKECVFVNTALKLQCHIVKNTLLQTRWLCPLKKCY